MRRVSKKRMDKFLVNHPAYIRSYIIQTFISHHFPIMLKWDKGEQKRSQPLKFNLKCHKMDEFGDLV